MNEEQVMHAMGLDDAYHVERLLARGRGGVTELVTLDGAGPFIRKKVPLDQVDRSVWAALSNSKHPRLPRVAATYELPDMFAAVYDYVPGNTLEQVVDTGGRPAVQDAVEVMAEVCDAVAALHNLGVIHRDLSPANVIVAADGAHLIDFGLARMASDAEKPGEKPLGTWGFAAPEQFGFAKADARSDVYALGRLLAYLLTGLRPDDEGFDVALADDAMVPPALRTVVEHATSFDRGDRYQSADDLRAALLAAMAGDAEDHGPRGDTADAAAGGVDGRGDSGDGVVHAVDDASPAENPAGSSSRNAGPAKPAALRSRSLATPSGASAQAPAGWEVQRRFNPIKWVAVAAMIVTIAAVACFVWTTLGKGGDPASTNTSASTASSSKAPQPVDDDSASSAANELSLAGVQATDDMLAITESGWSVDEVGLLRYGLAIKNTSEYDINYLIYKVTGYAKDGSVTFSEESTDSTIYAGQTVYKGKKILDDAAAKSYRVEFTVTRPSDFDVRTPSKNPPIYEVKNVKESVSSDQATITGTVRLVKGKPADTNYIDLTLIMRDKDGRIVGGAINYVSGTAENRDEPFSFEIVGAPEHASVEVYAYSL